MKNSDHGTWIPLDDLRNGAIFETQDGIRAVKSEYHYSNENPQPLCILLASGEFAHFVDKERTLVRELTFAAAEAAAYERAAKTVIDVAEAAIHDRAGAPFLLEPLDVLALYAAVAAIRRLK